ncbi:dienelactone hydrolase family protein [Methylobacterium sp. sgz302541]|uniref:dienelactone hydrolase family protein n=1 Tax=unclassified Methylobacterium TaxID=2615210 RepID=UPI003D33397E
MTIPAAPPAPRPPATRERAAFGEHAVSIETYPGAGKERGATPTILLLHDANGVGPQVEVQALNLADAGFRVVLPHYLDRTRQARAGFSEIARNFDLWRETVAAVLADAVSRTENTRVALVGRSLGGALALAAARDAEGVAAVAVLSAFLPPSLADRPLRLPPVLALHGGRDAIVQPSHAAALETGILRAGGACEVVLYPDQAHAFDAAAESDAGARTLDFLRRHLP